MMELGRVCFNCGSEKIHQAKEALEILHNIDDNLVKMGNEKRINFKDEKIYSFCEDCCSTGNSVYSNKEFEHYAHCKLNTKECSRCVMVINAIKDWCK